MRLLLDTHTLAWWLLDDLRLPSRTRALIADRENEIFASAVSAFEVATKFRIGKWNDIGPLAIAFEEIVATQNFVVLPIAASHACRAGLLRSSHRDPFDRLLAAQTEIEGLHLVTNDPKFENFGTRIAW
jgi:PIN domain nuclease of toxin-antitoxin system